MKHMANLCQPKPINLTKFFIGRKNILQVRTIFFISNIKVRVKKREGEKYGGI